MDKKVQKNKAMEEPEINTVQAEAKEPETEQPETEQVSKDAGSSFAAFCRIVELLRSENGCPWDRAQTFESLKPCMVNEMTEALAGIELYRKSGKAENLCEELGDVLLQVVLLSQIACEEGLFDITDVIQRISEKMIHRHPHVFGTEEEKEKKRSWEELKQEEKQRRPVGEKELEQKAFLEAANWVIHHLEKK